MYLNSVPDISSRPISQITTALLTQPQSIIDHSNTLIMQPLGGTSTQPPGEFLIYSKTLRTKLKPSTCSYLTLSITMPHQLKYVVIKKHTTPWITPQLKKKQAKQNNDTTYRNRLHRKFLTSHSETDRLVSCQFPNQVVHQQRLAKKQYVTSLIMKRATPPSIWPAVKLCGNNGSKYSFTLNANQRHFGQT
jgi:hypothetical protein